MSRMLLVFALLTLAMSAWPEDGERIEIVTVERAHRLAIENAPRIAVAQIRALEAREAVAVARSTYLPTLSASATLARADSNTMRIASGAVNNPSVYDREAIGIVATQLITDFGRTASTVEAASGRAMAERKRSQAAIAQMLLDVDILYYRTLQSQERTLVADKVVTSRRLFVERIEGLVANKLKSELDLSYARVSFEEGLMLQAQVENGLLTNRLGMATLLGYDAAQPFRLVEQPIEPPHQEPVDQLVASALRNNPALAHLRSELEATLRDSDAERALDYPTISAIGVAGRAFDHDHRMPDQYAAGAINLSLPLFAGGYYASRQRIADLRVERTRAEVRAAEDDLSKEVQVALANCRYAYERVAMSDRLLEVVSHARELARSRYDLGLVSVIELNQAELNQTDAEMTKATSRQEYLIQSAILRNRLGVGYGHPDEPHTPGTIQLPDQVIGKPPGHDQGHP